MQHTTTAIVASSYFNVSKREKQILNLLAHGYSSKEIATELYISEHTAMTHRKNLIQKFNAKNTVHLVSIAFRHEIMR